jgi:N-acetyl-gamma-glutamyl-phosphate reductase
MMQKTYKTAILGASGYTGVDMVRLALGHPNLDIAALGANSKAGQMLQQSYPHLTPYPLPRLQNNEDIDYTKIDVVFSCLPHAASAQILAKIARDCPCIIDLSADFRIKDADIYAQWYGCVHEAPELLPHAVYGLSEFAAPQLQDAKLVACPGCYPTASLLALKPLVARALIAANPISIFALSGVSGAGRSVREQNLFCEVAEAVHPYGLGQHRHMPEIEQELSIAAGGKPVQVSFTPHLVPINRGELVTCVVERSPGVSVADLRAALEAQYAECAFVHVLPEGVAPATRHVRGSNHCVLNVFADRIPGRALVVAALDNLVKGSSGQALQNFNLTQGLLETTGLESAALFP